MTSNNVTRLDPMNTVVDYEFLRVAHMLMVKQQNLRYWEGVPYPKRPVGQVRYEVARQVSTFAVPLLILGLAWFTHHLVGLLIGVPVAWFVGFVLDRMLARAISAKLKRDIRIDSGRYDAVMWLSKRMGLAPDEITLPVIYKMAADYRTVETARRQAELRDEAAREARNAKRRRVRAGDDDAASTGSTTGAVEHERYADEDEDDAVGYNPVTGLPMLPGRMFDAAGNTFGNNNTGFGANTGFGGGLQQGHGVSDNDM
jgi:hypothetical protein